MDGRFVCTGYCTSWDCILDARFRADHSNSPSQCQEWQSDREALRLSYWNGMMEHADLMTDSSGTAIFSVPPSATEFSLMGGGTEKEPYRTAYADCGDPVTTKFPISTATQIGIVPRNRCGHASVLARPGEVVYWALPLSWLAQQFQ
jgi:hypothetical protein